MTRHHGHLLVVLLGVYLACGFLLLYPQAQNFFLMRGYFGTHSLSGGAMPNLLAQLPVRWGAQAWVLSAALYSLLLLSRGLWAIVPWLIIYAFLCLADALILPFTVGLGLMCVVLAALALFAIIDARAPMERFPFCAARWSLGPYLIGIGIFIWFLDPLGAIAIAFFFNPAWIPARQVNPREGVVVFFDGYCGLCSTAVDFLMAEDLAQSLRYSPLQSETAERLRKVNKLPIPEVAGQFDSLVVKIDENVYTQSAAVLKLAPYLGGLWRPFGAAGLLVPKGLRNWVYGLVAKNRYRIFGKLETCRMPTREERKLFI